MDKIKCTRCEKVIRGEAVWLELNWKTGRYHETVPPEFSQGGFPFGKACARKVLADG